jgi:hypothetical protein
VPGEPRRPTEALKPVALLPSSHRDRIQEIQGGPRWEGRIEGGGIEGGGGSGGSHRIWAPRGAHPRGVGQGSGAGPGPPPPPAGADDGLEGEAAAVGVQRLPG